MDVMDKSNKINSVSILNSFLIDSLLLKLTSTQSLSDLVPPRHFEDVQFLEIQNNLNDDLKSKLFTIKQNIEYEFIHNDYDYSTSDDTQYQYSISIHSAINFLKKSINDQAFLIFILSNEEDTIKRHLESKIKELSHSSLPLHTPNKLEILDKFNQLQQPPQQTPGSTPTTSTSTS
ncbi:hypothetical protein E3P96_01511 [Wallemia ichthyophaga]|uniref:Uncharacterized protein n=1 Tax=Wallemia ichthyophaga TaxID=245174 RepID=A0A4T0GTC0_WALIC|nr:hypothetical protein E3P96_01511 [Wallemia ichthyophaga]TIB36816.1 hypothetical protein E3P86_02376 [Wallemia ichthyophaga]